MPDEPTHKHSLLVGIGEKVISFVVGMLIAAFFLGGARAKIQTLGRDMDNWKVEWKERDKQITRMDLEGSVATKNFVHNYEKEQAQQYARLKHLEDQVGHLETMTLRIDRLEQIVIDGQPKKERRP
jgi:hypothetical protein